MSDHICGDTVKWKDTEDIPDGQINICERSLGHEGLHRDGALEWATDFESFEDYCHDYGIDPDGSTEAPVAFQNWVLATTGWDGMS